ncbi:PIN domain-containing protein [[Kitasatospora] papulosa]|uniref:PIN domain-containing protein n=1 Tax=Streptomyces TaxID=1883 RepID=UPI0029B6CE1D|nr:MULTISPECIES: PIN domain-containing protein [unclassified Streptomyces]MDX3181523.1 PIN domain-containing protein [Streptomyces sp. ME02-7008A-1]MDX3302833.1 PIN domain-containing protein [Streptomyces sp. ME02-7008A]
MEGKSSGSFMHGYESFSRRPASEIRAAISSSTIALDTNAIINLYRMDKEAREEYLSVLAEVADRVWIPRQVADEFHRTRLSAVSSHINSLEAKSEKVTEAALALKTALQDFAKLRSLADGRSKEYLAPLDEAISKILSHVANDVEGFDLNAGKLASHDPILERLAVLFDGKVGEMRTEDAMREAQEEAKRRGDLKIPPGYRDVESKGEKGYGDYLIWNELIEYAKISARSMVFVSTDLKDDWIRHQAGLAIGARPELVAEMKMEAGVDYLHLPLADFLKHASSVLLVEVSQNTIAQVKHQEREEVIHAKLWNNLHSRMNAVSFAESKVDHARDQVMMIKARTAEALDDIRGLEAILEDVTTSEKQHANIRMLLADRRSDLARAHDDERMYTQELRLLEQDSQALSREMAEAERALAARGYKVSPPSST